jgi:alkylation response protein AidB-like acyl-CoA dehydrogenase
MPVVAVSLRRGEPSPSAVRVATRGRAVLDGDRSPDLASAAETAHDLASWLPMPGRGDTVTLWEALASLGAVDLTLARVAEPHLDAHAILDEARRVGQVDESVWTERADEWASARLWQVYAAEGSQRLLARDGPAGWHLDGVKPWCSLAEHADHALVTAWIDDRSRGLFAVDLRHEGVVLADTAGVAGQAGTWAARGLRDVRSTGLRFSSVPAVAIGERQWYLARAGFAWGGVGVAAIWYGASVALARRVRDAAVRREPDQIALLHLGAVDTALVRARCVLQDAAGVADDPATALDESVHVASRVRQVVADSAEEVLERVGHALGPAPLTGDEEHARRVADLTVYLRQHHAERDLASQGGRLLDDPSGWRWW